MIMKFFDEDNKDSSVTSVLEFELALTDCPFQFGPIIKLPFLWIIPSIHGQPYGIDQSAI